jgi:hypothetical protein
LLGDLSTN